MGTYVNPGLKSFFTTINSEIYVDKSGLLEYLNSVMDKKQKYVCVSRPRRFGKTTAADMVCAYYDSSANVSDVKTVFAGFAISKSDNYLKYMSRYIVLHINMTDFFSNPNGEQVDVLSNIDSAITHELKEEFNIDGNDVCNNLKESVEYLSNSLNKQFVVVIDEWDCVFRSRPQEHDLQKRYLDYLNFVLKDNQNISLVYMTGILPIKKYGEHSALNMFDEFSMTDSGVLSEFVGFTDEEVRDLCEEYAIDFKSVKEWYDGYNLKFKTRIYEGEKIIGWKSNCINIYSPESVVACMTKGEFKNYWNATETIEALKIPINRNEDGLNEIVGILMKGGRHKINTKKYQNDMTTFLSADDVLTMLVHLGYLGYDFEKEEVYIPNKEIQDEYKNSVENSEKWKRLFAILNDSEELLEATWNMDDEKVAQMLEFAHDRASNKTYNSEAALSYAVQYAYYSAHNYYSTIQELDTGKGYADIVYLPAPDFSNKPALLIELKYNKNTETAIDQIRKRNYPQVLENYKGNIIAVGINYDVTLNNNHSDYKHHSCSIERL